MKGDNCNCIDIQHDHPSGACPNPEPVTGAGQCNACRYFRRLDPGSDAAVEAGCLCPVMDNNRGRGYLGQPGVFVMNFYCPLHGGR